MRKRERENCLILPNTVKLLTTSDLYVKIYRTSFAFVPHNRTAIAFNDILTRGRGAVGSPHSSLSPTSSLPQREYFNSVESDWNPARIVFESVVTFLEGLQEISACISIDPLDSGKVQ